MGVKENMQTGFRVCKKAQNITHQIKDVNIVICIKSCKNHISS